MSNARTTITSRYNHLVEHLELLLRDLEARQWIDEWRKDPNEDIIYYDVTELYAAWQKLGGAYYG